MDKSTAIHLPLNNKGQTVRVFVTPSKTYGKYQGHELILKYGRKAKELTNEPEVDKIFLFIPMGNLSKTIKVNGGTFNTRLLFNRIEDEYGKHILCKRELRALKYYQNVSIKLPTSILNA